MIELDLPDLNLWLALADPDHQHHDRALHYWERETAAEMVFCRVTMLGFLRLLTNAKVMHGAPVTPSEAWAAYEAFSALPEVGFLEEIQLVETQFMEWSKLPGFAPDRWTDAWLAATAHTAGARLVSFDRSFISFPGLRFLHLKP